MIDSNSLFQIWLGFTILSIIVIVPFVIWAIRSGQFSKNDYASHLPLKSMIIDDKLIDNKSVDKSPVSAYTEIKRQ
jgi:nitrogen fixation-related uncharacterized protein